MSDGDGFVENDAIAIDAFAGDAVEALGNVDSLDLQVDLATGVELDRLSVRAESIGGEFVAVAGDVEEDLAAEHRGVVDSGVTGAVGDEADVAGRLKLD